MPLIRWAFWLMLLSFANASPALAQASARVEVSGAVQKSLDLDAAALAAFPAAAIGQFTQSRSGSGASRSSPRPT